MISTISTQTQTEKKFVQLPTISVSRSIQASSEKVWQVIATPEHLEYCHPFCDKNPAESWSGVGSKDKVYFYSGKVLDRYCREWIEGEGYDLDLTFINLDTQAEARFRISPDSLGNESVLTISLTLKMPAYFPSYFRWILFYLILQPTLKRYLDSVLKGFEYYITTGQPVSRNQFGSNAFFSPE